MDYEPLIRKNIVLINPKYPHNVGEVLRSASCYGVDRVLMTGDRVALVGDGKKYRLPREERMREYGEVEPTSRPFDDTRGTTPVAVELVPDSENLLFFDHPESATYIFGPEDGHLDRATLGQCHRFVQIPTRHCLNLAQAVSTLLYDRHYKRVMERLEEPLGLASMVR